MEPFPRIDPVRLKRDRLSDLPSIEELVRLADEIEWILVEINATSLVQPDRSRSDETKAAREGIIRDLAARLPGHRVWDGGFLPDEASLPEARRNQPGTLLTGTVRFSMRRKVTEQDLASQFALLVSAAEEYRTLANALMRQLADHLGADLAAFATEPYGWHRHFQSGQMAEWNYFFHGGDCAFGNRTTGICVEAGLGRGDDFGTFDPGFFLRFVNSNPAYRPLAETLRDGWDNARFALEFLEREEIVERPNPESEHARRWTMVSSGAKHERRG